MSTTHFDAEELGNVAAVIASNRFGNREEALAYWAEQLAIVSEANCQAYNDRYNDDAQVQTAELIKGFAPHVTEADRLQAKGTASTLLSNIDQTNAAAVLVVAQAMQRLLS